MPMISGVISIKMEEDNVNTAAAIIIPKMTWPALILAASRNDRVMGRMMELKVSTKDRNLEISVGVFSGKK